MATVTNVDRIRKSALETAEKSDKNFTLFLWAVGVLELVTVTTYVVLAVLEFSEPVLIGVAGACVYTLIAAGLFGLKFHTDNSTNRIITALQLLAEDADESQPDED